MYTSSAIKAYNTVSVESEIIGADPHKLISLLYRGALLEIANAKNGISRKEIQSKGASITKTIAIIGEGLNASLDKKVGGELAQNLSSLYDYMISRLIAANLNNDIAALDEVALLLTDLKGAWDTIRPNQMQPEAPRVQNNNAQKVYGRA
ncbi:flagellar export chaperone FliS [Sulfurirhabdus autotrophica]|uniref:Flagellar secretion chaperone FliS n=1 Tax=Sulfurirhabdus autotrophica TaxID=1706046 RepID=A0A4R3YCI8_9PROT|nr:flagellar export chaperone FliS [Sulfurirhabdus autotrophica]TCV90165.1 flagellar protein FliS [Sulfurirhabdus autotrophica]